MFSTKKMYTIYITLSVWPDVIDQDGFCHECHDLYQFQLAIRWRARGILPVINHSEVW